MAGTPVIAVVPDGNHYESEQEPRILGVISHAEALARARELGLL